jgi:predicted transcriptional regulator of viral defense system
MRTAGVTAENRELVARLRRSFAGPFSAAEAAEATDLAPERAARLLRHLAAQGWVTRVRRGLYANVPLEAEDPQSWRIDPWSIAIRVFEPCYIGGWTALHHWDLTDQLFSTTVVLTGQPTQRREREIGGARFEVRHRAPGSSFGTRRAWREGVATEVSDPERTLVDCLDDPSLAGGARHLAEALAEWHARDDAKHDLLLEYGDRLGNRTVFKRLGFLLEALGLDAGQLVSECKTRVSAGVSLLDPSRPAAGSITTRWNLRVNAGIEP